MDLNITDVLSCARDLANLLSHDMAEAQYVVLVTPAPSLDALFRPRGSLTLPLLVFLYLLQRG